LVNLGFDLIATRGTARVLKNNSLPVEPIHKIAEGRPNIIDAITNGEIVLVLNTVSGHKARADETKIRTAAVRNNIPCITTLPGIEAAINGMESIRAKDGVSVKAIQDYHAGN